jgi:hypothetical protein
MGDPSLVLNVVRRMMRKFLRQDLTELGIQQSESTAADDGAAEKSPLVKHSLP